MRSKFTITILSVFLVLSSCYVTKEPEQPEVYQRYVANQNVLLYFIPVTDSVICTVRRGDTVIVLKNPNYYHLVRYKQFYGWMGLDSLHYIGKSGKTAFGTPPPVTYHQKSANNDTIYAHSNRTYNVSNTSSGGPVYVRGYYRKDGTYVRSYTRRAPSKH